MCRERENKIPIRHKAGKPENARPMGKEASPVILQRQRAPGPEAPRASQNREKPPARRTRMTKLKALVEQERDRAKAEERVPAPRSRHSPKSLGEPHLICCWCCFLVCPC